jgi:hypothetical protein
MKRLSFVIILIFFQATFPTVLGDLAASMEPGTWAELKTNVPNGQTFFEFITTDRPSIFRYAENAAWDPETRQLFYMGSPHQSTSKFIVYSDETNTWEARPLPENIYLRHAYDHVTLGNGAFYYRAQPSFYKYSISSQSWSKLPDVPTDLSAAGAFVFFPEMNGVFNIDRKGLSFYSPGPNQWSRIYEDFTMGTYHNIAEYNPMHKAVLFGGGEQTPQLLNKMDASGKVVKLNNAPFGVSVTLSNLALDPVSGKYIVIRSSNDAMYEYDMTADSWRNLNMKSPFTVVDRHCVVSAPISTYGVIIYLSEWGGNSTVWLYKHTSASATQVGSRPMEHPAIQVSPNPFNNRTTFEFNVQSSKMVHQITDLTNNVYTWYAGNNYPAGIYIIKAGLGKSTLSRKIILQK